MSDFAIKIKGEEYELDKLTFGEARILRKHFNVTDLQDINAGDPDVLAGLCYLAMKRANPEWEHQRLINTIDALTFEDIEAEDADEPSPKGEVGS